MVILQYKIKDNFIQELGITFLLSGEVQSYLKEGKNLHILGSVWI